MASSLPTGGPAAGAACGVTAWQHTVAAGSRDKEFMVISSPFRDHRVRRRRDHPHRPGPLGPHRPGPLGPGLLARLHRHGIADRATDHSPANPDARAEVEPAITARLEQLAPVRPFVGTVR